MWRSETLLALLALLPNALRATPVDYNADSLVSRATSFNNPVLWEDYPDLDVFRVGDVFYYSSSTFAFSPGAPVLKSYDLVNWTPVSHSVPTLNFGTKYDLPSSSNRAYVKGIFASTLRYRKSTDTFIWLGCVEYGKSWVWTAPGMNAVANNGEVSSWTWTAKGTLPCYYDSGLFIDDDDTMYVAYGGTQIHVALRKSRTSKSMSHPVMRLSRVRVCTRRTAITTFL
jgi:beta-xylosidase